MITRIDIGKNIFLKIETQIDFTSSKLFAVKWKSFLIH